MLLSLKKIKMKKIIFLFLPLIVFSQVKTKKQLAHTYSIVAMDEKTGEMAVGVQSHWFSVGTIVSWGKSGVGVVAIIFCKSCIWS